MSCWQSPRTSALNVGQESRQGSLELEWGYIWFKERRVPLRTREGSPVSAGRQEGLSQHEALGWRTLVSPGHSMWFKVVTLALVRKGSPASWITLWAGHAREGWVQRACKRTSDQTNG